MFQVMGVFAEFERAMPERGHQERPLPDAWRTGRSSEG